MKALDFYNYFRACYKLDYKEFVIDNILARKFPYKWFVTNEEELIHENLPLIPYFNNKVSDLEKEIELHKLEKKLFYAIFFVVGSNENPIVKDKRICAPLVLFPAKIRTIDDEKFLEVDRNSFMINRSVLSRLEPKNNLLTKDLFVNELSTLLSSQGNFFGLKSLLDKNFLNLDTNELPIYPGVWSGGVIRKFLAEHQFQENAYKIIPAAGTIFVEKSESSFRVLNDLAEMAKKAEFNTGLSELLSVKENRKQFDFSYYKSRLNVEQYQALVNAHRFSNSVIVGPPGTGKSYTITTIVADAVVKKQSVLIVSKTKQAVEILRSMLRDEFKLKDYLIHTSGTNYKASLKSKIRKYLSGIIARRSAPLNEKRIEILYSELTYLEKEFEKFIDRELELSDLEFGENLSFFEKWRKFYLKDIKPNGEKLWELFEQSELLLKKLESEVNTYSRRKIQSNINAGSRSFRKDMSLFMDALESKSFTKYKRLLKEVNHGNILKVFPIWLANLSDLNAVLPMQKELFDLVIIDEATQCDIASALPALYRAKRAIVVGDPNQLRHYSFVSSSQQIRLLKKYNLPDEKIFDYRNRSILDFYISRIQHQDQVSFLREHFRSAPSLIEFSNRQFYDGQIEVIKSTPKHVLHKQIELIEVNGRRNEKGVNIKEADKVIAKLDDLIHKYDNDEFRPSIGIISPFNAQVTYINKRLKQKYELDILKKFNLLCGTPYHFQGSEREIVLLSFCVCDHTHPAAFNHVNKPEVLNVAITRAKSYQYIFRSVTGRGLDKDSLLYHYFRFINEFKYGDDEKLIPDEFQDEVVNALQNMAVDEVRTGYPVAGSLLDILITKNGRNYFIDLIGYPGMFKDAFTMERYKTLARTGIRSMPLHYSFWKENKADAIKKIKAFIA